MEQYIARPMFFFCGMGTEQQPLLGKTASTRLGTETAHAILGDDNMFDGQIQPVNDKWWKAFDDPMLDSLIATASTKNFSVLSAIDRMDMAKAQLANRTGEFLSFRFLEWWMGTSAK